ncbi:hypothetical protein KUCAC02_019006 [Chaenocephalus aceratus]|uniref:Uncharacterized protein n=1 Tax=Chaenocephalus aceratus TaxID=36190 RepID=A0ACB9WAV6_CHAAC|nr:hypothetical protein KUCAC02_019006 [Chaenocephalus aceratus]
MIASTHSVASSFLPASARVNPASQSQANQGSETIRQQYQGKMPVPVINRIANAEAPVIVELAQTLSLDKPALQEMKLSRTAASYKMIHGLGRTYSERTFSNMKIFPFSLNLDESTSNNNKKILSMLVFYYHADLWKVIVEHLGSLEIVKYGMLMDSCAVMRGSKTGFEIRMHQYCPNLLDVDGDSCHHIHNAAKKFSEPFDSYLEKLFSDLQVDHQWSPDQVMYLKEIAMILNLPASSPQRGFVPHRWLSAYDASMATHAMMPAYRVLYYGFLSTADKELYREPLELMYTKYHVNQAGRASIKVVQEELNRKGMTPQGRERKKRGSQTLVHKLHDRQLELFLAFMACFVKAEHITQLSPRALREMVLEDHMLLPSKEVYVGQEADMFRSQNPNHALLVPFLADVRKAYCTSPLQCTSRRSSPWPAEWCMLQHLLPADQDIQRELVRFNVDLTIPIFKEGDSIVEWWGHVFDKPDKYPSLSAMQQQQSKYGSQASGSAQQAKKQTAEEEKRARLRHVAKQRKRAMETLVVQAKKKKLDLVLRVLRTVSLSLRRECFSCNYSITRTSLSSPFHSVFCTKQD